MSSFGKFITGALVGGAVGAAIGMLLAPRSGVETREMIREEFETRYRSSADALREKGDVLKEKAEAFKEKARKVSDELEEVGRRTVSRFNDRGEKDVPSDVTT